MTGTIPAFIAMMTPLISMRFDRLHCNEDWKSPSSDNTGSPRESIDWFDPDGNQSPTSSRRFVALQQPVEWDDSGWDW